MICGAAWFPLYYLPVLFQFMILTPLLQYKKVQYLFMVILTPLFLIFSYAYRYLGHEVNPDVFRLFWPWSAFFAFGVYMQNKEITVRMKNMISFFFLLLIISMSESETIIQIIGNKQLATGQNTITSSLLALLIFTICVKISRTSQPLNSNILTKMGRYSFGIYLLHGIIGPFVYQVVSYLHTDCSLILLTANFIILISCYIGCLMIEKILPAKFVNLAGLK